jgi:aerobic C4-dicarboxylate transport protein
VATVAVAAWEGDIDRERAHAVLDGQPVPPSEDDADVADVADVGAALPSPARA